MASRRKSSADARYKKLLRQVRKLHQEYGIKMLDRAVLEATEAPPSRPRGRPMHLNAARDASILSLVQSYAQEHNISEAAAMRQIAPLRVPPRRLLGTGGLGDMVTPTRPGRYSMIIMRELTAKVDEDAILIRVDAINHAVRRAKQRLKVQGKI